MRFPYTTFDEGIGIMEGEMSTTQLAVTSKDTRLATPAPEFSNDQIRLLGETVAKGCDQNELAFFLHVAKLKRLDPFTGQIHVVKRWDSALGKEKMTVQVGIDGFRVIASRTDDLAGIDDAEYDTDVDEHPNVATVTVYRYGRNDERIPYKATARWDGVRADQEGRQPGSDVEEVAVSDARQVRRGSCSPQGIP